MEDEQVTIQPEIYKSDSGTEKQKSRTEDEVQVITPPKTRKKESKPRISPQRKSKLSLKSKVSAKSKCSSKSVVNTPSNKVLLTKSLDSVKALLASKQSSSEGTLKLSESLKKISRGTSIGLLLKKRQVKGKKSKKGKKTQEKILKLTADIVRKVARELIRKRGHSLLIIHPSKMVKKRSYKKKTKK